MMILEILSYIIMSLGLFCSIIGSYGILIFPDTYTRIHAATVTIIGGSLLLSSGAALFMLTSNILFSIKAITIAAIIFVTSPVSSHAIIRAAYKSKVPLWKGSVGDKLKEVGGIDNN